MKASFAPDLNAARRQPRTGDPLHGPARRIGWRKREAYPHIAFIRCNDRAVDADRGG